MASSCSAPKAIKLSRVTALLPLPNSPQQSLALMASFPPMPWTNRLTCISAHCCPLSNYLTGKGQKIRWKIQNSVGLHTNIVPLSRQRLFPVTPSSSPAWVLSWRWRAATIINPLGALFPQNGYRTHRTQILSTWVWAFPANKTLVSLLGHPEFNKGMSISLSIAFLLEWHGVSGKIARI